MQFNPWNEDTFLIRTPLYPRTVLAWTLTPEIGTPLTYRDFLLSHCVKQDQRGSTVADGYMCSWLICYLIYDLGIRIKVRKEANLFKSVHSGGLLVVVNSDIERSLPQRYPGEILHVFGLRRREQHRLSLPWGSCDQVWLSCDHWYHEIMWLHCTWISVLGVYAGLNKLSILQINHYFYTISLRQYEAVEHSKCVASTTTNGVLSGQMTNNASPSLSLSLCFLCAPSSKQGD